MDELESLNSREPPPEWLRGHLRLSDGCEVFAEVAVSMSRFFDVTGLTLPAGTVPSDVFNSNPPDFPWIFQESSGVMGKIVDFRDGSAIINVFSEADLDTQGEVILDSETVIGVPKEVSI